MGVCCVLYAVDDETLETIVSDPPTIWQLLEPEDPSRYLTERASFYKVPLWAKIVRKRPGAPPERRIRVPDVEQRFVDLDNSWDGLRACIAAVRPDAPELFDGPKVRGVEVGYGPAIYHYSSEMNLICESYSQITEAEILAALQTTDFSKADLGKSWERADDEDKEYLLSHFRELKSFLRGIAANHLGTTIQFT